MLKQSTCKDSVMSILKKAGRPMSRSDLASATGYAQGTVTTALNKLKSGGHVVEEMKGRIYYYSLPGTLENKAASIPVILKQLQFLPGVPKAEKEIWREAYRDLVESLYSGKTYAERILQEISEHTSQSQDTILAAALSKYISEEGIELDETEAIANQLSSELGLTREELNHRAISEYGENRLRSTLGDEIEAQSPEAA